MATFYTKWCFSGTSSPNSETYTIDGEKVTYSNDVRFKYVVTEKVNASANTSTLVVDKYAIFYYTWDTSAHWLDVTSRSKIPSSASYKSETKNIRSSSALDSYLWQYIGQDSFTVSHNADGSGSTTFTGNGYYTGGSGTTYSKSVSATINLTKINRTSTITTSATTDAGKLFGDEVTFNITKKDSSFTHKLTFTSGETTYTIAENVDTTASYTFPIDLIKNYPNAVKNGITITCTTYKGDVKIGASNCTVYLSVPDEYVPTCSLALEEANETMLELGWGVYVKSKSQVKGVITANGVEGSTIKSYSSSGNKQSFSTSEFTTGFLTESDTLEFKSTITDSRGRAASDSKTIEVIDYKPPTINNVQIERCNVDGTLNNEGTYGKAVVEYSISPINDLNAKTIRVTYGDVVKEITPTEYEGRYEFTELFSGLETTGSYDFIFELIDAFDIVPINYLLPPAFVTRSFLRGGKGVSIGQIATQEGFHSHMDSEFHKNTKVKNININGLKIEKMNVGGWICYVEDEA